MPETTDKKGKRNLDALFNGLTVTQASDTSDKSDMPEESSVQSISSRKKKASTSPVTEQRFCSIVKTDTMNKIRAIAKRQGLQVKDIVQTAFEIVVDNYESKFGEIQLGQSDIDLKELFT